MTDKKQEIAKQANAELSTDITDLMSSFAGQGFENVTSNEITIPQARILQSTSPAVNDGKGRQGEIFNSMTEENYGKSLTFIPLFFFGSRVKFIDEKSLSSGIDCQSRDGLRGSRIDAMHANGDCTKCPFAQWRPQPGEADKGPECIEFKNVLVIPIVEGVNVVDTTPVVLSGKRKAIQPYKKFLTSANALRLAGKPVAFFASMWTLETVKVENGKGTFFVPNFKREGYLQDRDTLVYVQSQYLAMKEVQQQLNIHQGEEDDDGAPAPSTSEEF